MDVGRKTCGDAAVGAGQEEPLQTWRWRERRPLFGVAVTRVFTTASGSERVGSSSHTSRVGRSSYTSWLGESRRGEKAKVESECRKNQRFHRRLLIWKGPKRGIQKGTASERSRQREGKKRGGKFVLASSVERLKALVRRSRGWRSWGRPRCGKRQRQGGRQGCGPRGGASERAGNRGRAGRREA